MEVGHRPSLGLKKAKFGFDTKNNETRLEMPRCVCVYIYIMPNICMH